MSGLDINPRKKSLISGHQAWSPGNVLCSPVYRCKIGFGIFKHFLYYSFKALQFLPGHEQLVLCFMEDFCSLDLTASEPAAGVFAGGSRMEPSRVPRRKEVGEVASMGRKSGQSGKCWDSQLREELWAASVSSSAP